MRYVLAVLGFMLSAAALASGRLLHRYVVSGESMLPAYRPGDRLIAEAWTYRLRPPRPAEVVVVKQIGTNGRKDLKRIAAAPGSTASVLGVPTALGPHDWYVLGDNLDASSDSRQNGPVQRRDILAKVWFRY